MNADHCGASAAKPQSRSRSTGSRNARPLRVCDRQKEKGSDKVISMLLPMSTDVRSLDRSRLPLARSAIKSRVLMYAYATRGLGFLVRCATISRQLGQGRQRSGGSPLFMINHRSSNIWKISDVLSMWGFAALAPIIPQANSHCQSTKLTALQCNKSFKFQNFLGACPKASDYHTSVLMSTPNNFYPHTPML